MKTKISNITHKRTKENLQLKGSIALKINWQLHSSIIYHSFSGNAGNGYSTIFLSFSISLFLNQLLIHFFCLDEYVFEMQLVMF